MMVNPLEEKCNSFPFAGIQNSGVIFLVENISAADVEGVAGLVVAFVFLRYLVGLVHPDVDTLVAVALVAMGKTELYRFPRGQAGMGFVVAAVGDARAGVQVRVQLEGTAGDTASIGDPDVEDALLEQDLLAIGGPDIGDVQIRPTHGHLVCGGVVGRIHVKYFTVRIHDARPQDVAHSRWLQLLVQGVMASRIQAGDGPGVGDGGGHAHLHFGGRCGPIADVIHPEAYRRILSHSGGSGIGSDAHLEVGPRQDRCLLCKSRYGN